MKKTISQTVTDTMTDKGYKLVGKTTGNPSFRNGTNLARKLASLGLTEADVTVKTGARRQHATEGYELLIFVKA